MLNILRSLVSSKPANANDFASRQAEARWSARTPCPVCGARCLVAPPTSRDGTFCVWCGVMGVDCA